ncbi:hypothetical protein Q3G72_028080 [Acer saccharum]|nr:hypothetical protein Q3G72_028080 [Acer saccharum]
MGYMVVTMHFIDKSWVLHSRIMRFIHVLSPHDAESLGDQLVKCLFDWNVDRKLSTIAVDNCSTNDSMIDKIKNKFSDKLLLGGKFFHMRCCAHILNLVVRDGLKVIADGIEKIRDSVCFWIASSKAVDSVSWRVACWFKNCGLGSSLPPSILLLNLKLRCVDTIKGKRKVRRRWKTHADGSLIFNVDGSSRGNPNPFGIDGILRDNDGATVCMFSSSIGCESSYDAEVAAILQACQLCESNFCPVDVKVSIESDCKTTVLWANGVGSAGNVRLMDSILEIREILSRLKAKVCVRFVSRNENTAADFLAKQGVANSLV